MAAATVHAGLKWLYDPDNPDGSSESHPQTKNVHGPHHIIKSS